ncbi:MAG TPA: hypothetical protein PLN21_10825 [Gemmatales bacterium]|nr:hypothetical protein [Gemmatales bacterium]
MISGVCQKCNAVEAKSRAETERKAKEARKAQELHELSLKREAEALRLQLEEEEAGKKYLAARRGEASQNDLRKYEAEGYLIAGSKLIECPVCGHNRFHSKRIMMNTQLATVLHIDWSDNTADTRICKNCSHVLWFAR